MIRLILLSLFIFFYFIASSQVVNYSVFKKQNYCLKKGEYFYKLNQLDSTAKYFQRARDLGPIDGFSNFKFFESLMKIGKTEEAYLVLKSSGFDKFFTCGIEAIYKCRFCDCILEEINKDSALVALCIKSERISNLLTHKQKSLKENAEKLDQKNISFFLNLLEDDQKYRYDAVFKYINDAKKWDSLLTLQTKLDSLNHKLLLNFLKERGYPKPNEGSDILEIIIFHLNNDLDEWRDVLFKACNDCKLNWDPFYYFLKRNYYHIKLFNKSDSISEVNLKIRYKNDGNISSNDLIFIDAFKEQVINVEAVKTVQIVIHENNSKGQRIKNYYLQSFKELALYDKKIEIININDKKDYTTIKVNKRL